jgi:periplasmic copper chaperone A
MSFLRRPVVVLSAGVLALGLLSACASDSTSDGAAASSSSAGCPLTVTDPWVRATDTEMTGAFGIIENTSDAEVTVTSATSPQAGMMEIHEVVDQDGQMVMQPKEGGLTIPAGGSATLKPGGDHLMLMALPAPIAAGDEVEITVTCSTGATVTWTSVAKPFEGGAEPYVPADGTNTDTMDGMSVSPSPAES